MNNSNLLDRPCSVLTNLSDDSQNPIYTTTWAINLLKEAKGREDVKRIKRFIRSNQFQDPSSDIYIAPLIGFLFLFNYFQFIINHKIF